MESSLLGLQTAILSLCLYMARSLTLLIRLPVLSDYDSTLMTSLNLSDLLKPLLPNTVTLRVRAPAYEFGGFRIQFMAQGNTIQFMAQGKLRE